MFYLQKIENEVSRMGKINSMLATKVTMGVRPCVTAKLPVLRPWSWNLILLNLAPASCYFIASSVDGVRCKRFKVAACVGQAVVCGAPPCTSNT